MRAAGDSAASAAAADEADAGPHGAGTESVPENLAWVPSWIGEWPDAGGNPAAWLGRVGANADGSATLVLVLASPERVPAMLSHEPRMHHLKSFHSEDFIPWLDAMQKRRVIDGVVVADAPETVAFATQLASLLKRFEGIWLPMDAWRIDGGERRGRGPIELAIQDTPEVPDTRARKPRRRFISLSNKVGLVLGINSIVVILMTTPWFLGSAAWGWAKFVLAAMLVLVLPAIGVHNLLEAAKVRHRKKQDLCIECGYSRRGLAAEEACPECGAASWLAW